MDENKYDYVESPTDGLSNRERQSLLKGIKAIETLDVKELRNIVLESFIDSRPVRLTVLNEPEMKPESVDAKWKNLAKKGQLIEAIKEFRVAYGSGLVEAKKNVTQYHDWYRNTYLPEVTKYDGMTKDQMIEYDHDHGVDDDNVDDEGYYKV